MSIRQSHLVTVISLLLLLTLSACEAERTSGKRLVLPVGDVDTGKATFVNLGCIQCHGIKGVEMPEYEDETEKMLLLGGEIRKVKTYGELVTSIVNPNHIISSEYLKTVEKPVNVREMESPMPSFNDEMTVAQLIDLITFLDAQYKVTMPDYVSSNHNWGAY